MPLFARTEQELTAESLDDLSRSTNITKLSPGGKARALLQSVNKRIEGAYDIFDTNLARAFVSSAPGQYLDLIGEMLGVSREAPHAASVSSDLEVIKFYVEEGSFGDINNNTPLTIPTGTRISTQINNGGVVYRLVSDAVLLPAESTRYVSAEAIAPGAEYNIGTGALVFHDFVSYQDYFNSTLKVTNIHPVATGRNFESDANFRFRISNRVLEAEAANETSIRLAILSTPGVADVLMIPYYRGIGTFGAIIQSTTPTVSDALLDDVRARVAKAQSFGDIAYIRKPKETGLAMRLTVHYATRLPDSSLMEAEEALALTIQSYVNGLDLGQPFIMNAFVSELFRVSDDIVNFGEAGKPIDELHVYKQSKLEDNRVRSTLLGDYYPDRDERVIIEPTIINPISFTRAYSRR
jgi:uncharacterized phage protein gp47/JayE